MVRYIRQREIKDKKTFDKIKETAAKAMHFAIVQSRCRHRTIR